MMMMMMIMMMMMTIQLTDERFEGEQNGIVPGADDEASACEVG